jgi:hypothetical protein
MTPDTETEHNPEHAVDALKRWDEGEDLLAVRLGGIGPGYEQAIWVLVFELLREILHGFPRGIDPFVDPGSEKVDREVLSDLASRIEGEGEELGFSGAQVGMAWAFAYRVAVYGWREQVDLLADDGDRTIVVSRRWPRVPDPHASV